MQTRTGLCRLEYYVRFVELWRDADPELQSTLDVVRARMERLVAEGE